MKLKITKVHIIVLLLIVAGFIFRAYPHMLVNNWLPCEEEYNYMTVQDIIDGSNRRVDFYPMLEHYSVVFFSKVSTLDASLIAKYINPLFGALTIIPIFLLCRKYLNTKHSLFVSILWTFSEAVFYRTSYFGTTETMSLFLSMFALYFFIDKTYKYIPTIILLGLTFYTHLLPAVFTLTVIIIYKIIYGTKKEKIIFSSGIVATFLFLISPLNPHQRIVSLISPSTLLSKFNLANIFIYSPIELIAGVGLFLGLVILLCLSLYSFIKTPEPIFVAILITASLIFSISWIAYSPYLFAPPRLTLYFVLPLSFFAVKTLSRINDYSQRHTLTPKHTVEYLSILLISILMIFTAISNVQSMFWVNNALTNKEYEAIYYLKDNNLIDYPSYWWCDYGVRVALTANSNISMYETVVLNETVSEVYSKSILKPENTVDNNTSVFRYVFISERMKNEALFFVYTENRTQHIRIPVQDVWKNSEFWKLIYVNEEVIIYEFVG